MMSPTARRGWSSCVRIGLLGTIAIAAGAFLIWAALKPTQAGAAPASMQPAAFLKSKDQLLLTIGLTNPAGQKLDGRLTVELVGVDGKLLAAKSQQVEQSDEAGAYRFELPAPSVPLDQVELHFQYGKEEKFKVSLKEILVAKAHETSVSAGQEYHAGSLASARCGVQAVKSLTDSIPQIGAEVEIRLRTPDNRESLLYSGKTGKEGVADARFKVPNVPPGNYTLVVSTRSPLGEEKLEQPIKVKAETKILLTTDKPLYQPGQEMHIRALALRPFDLVPEAGQELIFEVEDAKGNKVFKRFAKTSEFGIASVDFQLADEVNMGDYQIRALLGQQQSQKTVTVKKYVLPKFKVEVKADKKFYMPKEKIQLDIQSDYFFGKPVAGAKLKVLASTFDVQFTQFKELNGTTDAQGHAKFEIQLPDSFVGQPLQKGDALVKLEVKLTDTADHSEMITKTYPVSDKAIRVSLIPEAGRLVPGMENRIFAAAIYPDGSPARCDVQLWTGVQPQGEPVAKLQTNDAGLAEFKLTPKAEQFRQGQWEARNIEMLGGQLVQVGGQQMLLDLTAQARDVKGNTARATMAVNADPQGDNVLLRLDKAIYKGGDTVQIDVRSSAGLPTAYIDIVRSGQTLLTKWLDVKDGKAADKLDLPANVFGTLEVHAYQMLGSGEIVRDGRVVYVHPREDLKIDVKASQDVFLPGAKGEIRFQVTDAAGKPTPAALGVIIVDEAVYALQDMQPGLEKVYFTLQEELLKPQAQVVYRPSESIDILVREPELPAAKQQIAQALLAPIRPKPPARWEVSPAFQRKQQMDAQLMQVAFALFQYAANNNKPVADYDKAARRFTFKQDLLKSVIQARQLNDEMLLDPFGQKLDLDSLAKIEKGFTAERLVHAATMQRMLQMFWTFINYTNQNQQKFFKNGVWTFPETVLADAAKQQRLDAVWQKDAWGNPYRLMKRTQKPAQPVDPPQVQDWEMVSAGPDGEFGTADDIKSGTPNDWQFLSYWWLADPTKAEGRQQNLAMLQRKVFQLQRNNRMAKGEGRGGGFGGLRDEAMLERAAALPPGAPVPLAAQAGAAPRPDAKPADRLADDKDAGGGGGGGQPPLRIREYFPETLLWRPALITDDKGVAVMPLDFADSITTWRLSASANSRGGALGGVTSPLRVFQDFFVDLDLPVSLTQNDEVAFPVAVYNYLKTSQTVKIDLQQESWFELIDSEGPSRSLDLKPNEVTAIKFRIKARKVGYQPLTVKAQGTKMSDAIKRVVEIVPDGRKVEQVVTDRLQGQVSQRIDIPPYAVADASKIIVKIYPGVMSQVLEGTEGMLRLPGG